LIEKLDMRPEAMKLPEGSIGEMLQDITISEDFWTRS
jgi:hypothetical protein